MQFSEGTNMNRILLLATVTMIALALPIPANTQEKTKKAQTSSKTDSTTKTGSPHIPITTQTAITENGRKALLKSDGTWQYGNNDVAVPQPTIIEKSTLSFDTGIVFRSGNTKPLARTTFYLLNNSLAKILLNDRLKTHEGKICETSRCVYAHFVFSNNLLGSNDSATEIYNMIATSIKPHLVDTVITDFGGKATFKAVPPGKYYIVGYSTISKNDLVWDSEVNLSPGNNSFTLDQNNTSIDF